MRCAEGVSPVGAQIPPKAGTVLKHERCWAEGPGCLNCQEGKEGDTVSLDSMRLGRRQTGDEERGAEREWIRLSLVSVVTCLR